MVAVIKRARSVNVHTDHDMKFFNGPPTRTYVCLVRRGGADGEEFRARFF